MLKKEKDKYIKDNEELKNLPDLNIVGVQPFSGPVGLAYALHYLYNEDKVMNDTYFTNSKNYIIDIR